MEETNLANENEQIIARAQQYQQYEVERLEIDCPSIAATAATVLKAITRIEASLLLANLTGVIGAICYLAVMIGLSVFAWKTNPDLPSSSAR